MCTSKCRDKPRYKGIDVVYVGVKFLYKHDLKGISQRDSQSLVWTIRGRGVSKKSNRTIWHFRWMPRFWKFSRKFYWAFPSWNWTWRGGKGRLEEEDLEPRRFWAKVDLCWGVVCSLSEREREREKHITNRTIRKKRKDTYAWKMHEHEVC